MFEDDDRNAVFVEGNESDMSTELIERAYHLPSDEHFGLIISSHKKTN